MLNFDVETYVLRNHDSMFDCGMVWGIGQTRFLNQCGSSTSIIVFPMIWDEDYKKTNKFTKLDLVFCKFYFKLFTENYSKLHLLQKIDEKTYNNLPNVFNGILESNSKFVFCEIEEVGEVFAYICDKLASGECKVTDITCIVFTELCRDIDFANTQKDTFMSIINDPTYENLFNVPILLYLQSNERE